MLSDVKSGRREPLFLPRIRFYEELPTLKDVLKADTGFKRDVRRLERTLKEERRFIQWIGEDIDNFSLEDILSDMRIAQDHPEITPAKYSKAQYNPPLHLMLLGHRNPPWIRAHEMMHALHFRALARRLTHEHLAYILKSTAPITINNLNLYYPKEMIDEHLDRLEQAHRGEMEMDNLPMMTRRFAILLLRQLTGPKGERAIEAIGSRFDSLFGGPAITLIHFSTQYFAYMALPSIWLGGLHKKISDFYHLFGYGNRLAYNQATQQDIFGSLIPELG
jgi:hypothetical protein